MAQNRHWEQDKDATIYMGNIDERATPAMMYEIMLQMGPIHNIHMPRDRVTQSHQGFGFVEFRAPADAEYAAAVMNGIKLFGKSLRVNKASADRSRTGPGGGPGGTTEIGAELFVGNLDPAADERVLYDTFSRFGPLLSLPKVARDDAGVSKGFGFVSFGDFESADAALEGLAGQYLLSNQVTVQYAFKRDGKGERHGDQAERELAAQARKRNVLPEAVPLPPGFLNPPPAAAAPPAQQPGSNGSLAAAPSTTPQPPAGFVVPPPGMPPGMHMGAPPPGFAPPPRGPSPYSNNNAGQVPPPSSAGRGGAPLPPAPSGLPARPPQSQGGYNNPADYHPSGGSGSSYRGGAPAPPPPGFPGAPQQQQQQQPPPGFGAPGNGAPPPPGFLPPPPGFPQQAPPGYPRR
ncbi:Nucleotide-binding, alpha-beta plait [Cordyceps fumosorosea ARSEF 2679]|uniref:Nucleotide-binding, alpha-beta plait n=1 Tax=Cordyceps fumosorosea (strain ARSEF 2679) TaxID=1081104 RepID=A0A167MCK6_CORFA|nr:Nucleotide-binding, alpha-beta plait [Cordyceps fumosorosea ARSEF 2679]OAA54203.1 Nucleotide-binding, alpha-beta plait [Cordyceps fumosorosea ARSEF 2679]